jgi:hypothetical protein
MMNLEQYNRLGYFTCMRCKRKIFGDTLFSVCGDCRQRLTQLMKETRSIKKVFTQFLRETE